MVYEKEISGTGNTQANKGILAHDAVLGQYCSIELRADAATAEQWTAIAQSILLMRATAPSEQSETPVLTAPAAPAAPAEGAFEKTEVTFPAYEQRNGYNDAIFDIAPFQASLYLPEGCAIAPLDEEGKTLPSCRFNLLWSKMGIFRDGKQIGTIGYNVFDDVEQAQGAYIAVYGQIMLGSLVTWNSEYTPVVEDADFRFASATCSLLGREAPPGVSAAGAAYERFPAVLAYHRDLGVYIGVAFEPNSITAQQQEAIARSVVIQAQQERKKSAFSSDGGSVKVRKTARYGLVTAGSLRRIGYNNAAGICRPRQNRQSGSLGAVFGLLVIYCLKDVSFFSGSRGLPELIAVAVVAAVHLWKRQMLLSIAAGTLCYMLLVQRAF